MKTTREPYILTREEIEAGFAKFPQYKGYFDKFFFVRITKRRSFKVGAFEKGDVTLGFIKDNDQFGLKFVAVGRYTNRPEVAKFIGDITYECCASATPFFEKVEEPK